MYHVLLALALALAYLALAESFSWFFEGRRATLAPRAAIRSILLILLVSFAADFASFSISDWQLANRVLHVFGGGFAGCLVAALAARDMGLAIGRVRFAILAALIVTALGMGNELVEFALQRYAHFRFAAGPLDTWFDLASNVAGIALGVLSFAWLVPRRGAEADVKTPLASV